MDAIKPLEHYMRHATVLTVLHKDFKSILRREMDPFSLTQKYSSHPIPIWEMVKGCKCSDLCESQMPNKAFRLKADVSRVGAIDAYIGATIVRQYRKRYM